MAKNIETASVIGKISMDFNRKGEFLASALINFESLSEVSRRYLIEYGLRQSLSDSFASAKTHGEAEGLFQKRLDGIEAGTVGTRSPVDALGKEVRRLADLAVRNALRGKVKLTAVPKDKMDEAVAKYTEANRAALETEAKANLNAVAAMDVGIDLSGLIAAANAAEA